MFQLPTFVKKIILNNNLTWFSIQKYLNTGARNNTNLKLFLTFETQPLVQFKKNVIASARYSTKNYSDSFTGIRSRISKEKKLF